ncbi:MAG: hypothetical protein FDZ70_07405 [Actinobacteria bacterium]|nr:MAG: hypothetical protein FDZ70_07405 [Actinomycetota bacterium]
MDKPKVDFSSLITATLATVIGGLILSGLSRLWEILAMRFSVPLWLALGVLALFLATTVAWLRIISQLANAFAEERDRLQRELIECRAMLPAGSPITLPFP